MAEPVTIITSIFSTRLEAQQKAVASWLESGFTVVSVNIQAEKEKVESFFAGVNFSVIDRPCDKVIGSRVYFSEIFSVIQTLPGSIFGIVNSDICLVADDSFPDFITENAADALVYGSRIDVDPCLLENSVENPFGFDYFFFSRSALPSVPETKFCLGMPVWDYWLPLAVAVSGFPLKKLITPVAWHVKHEEAWSDKENDAYWPLLAEEVACWLAGVRYDNVPVWQILPLLGSCWRDGSCHIRRYLHYQTEIIHYPDKEHRSLLAVHKGSLMQMRKDLLESLEQQVALQQQLVSISRSRSWRLTAPLRRINLLVKNIFGKS